MTVTMPEVASRGGGAASLAKSADAGLGHYADESDLGRYNRTEQAVAEKMVTLVKGAGYAVTDHTPSLGALPGANKPLADPEKVFGKAMTANKAWTDAHRRSHTNPDSVLKSFNGEFMSQYGAFATANPQSMMWNNAIGSLNQQLSQLLGKNITLTSPLSTGFVPYNLVAPSRLIYPVDLED